jgi:putative transposase
VLDLYAFDRLQQARLLTPAWMWIYNNERPHEGIGNFPPAAFLARRMKNNEVSGPVKYRDLALELLIKTVAA